MNDMTKHKMCPCNPFSVWAAHAARKREELLSPAAEPPQRLPQQTEDVAGLLERRRTLYADCDHADERLEVLRDWSVKAAAALESLARERDHFRDCISARNVRALVDRAEQAERNLVAARERVAALESDAARLDWFEASFPHRVALGRNDTGKWFIFGDNAEQLEQRHDSLRAAIDAARAGKGEG